MLLLECARLGVPGLAAPSANRFGRISPTTAQHVRDEFGAALTVLDGGACAVGIESAIVDCSRGRPVLLRLEYDGGHGVGGTRMQGQLRTADRWAFLLWQFGLAKPAP